MLWFQPMVSCVSNPLDENNHVGPLIDTHAVEMYNNALTKVVAEGGKILVAGGVLSGEGYESGCYVQPPETENTFEIVQHETFAFIFIEILRNCRECHCYSKRSSSRFIICNHDQ
jgi:acyl-CoA reductase-like NAD-dependent aldehyde dehydrogenase